MDRSGTIQGVKEFLSVLPGRGCKFSIFLAFTLVALGMVFGPLRDTLSSATRSGYYSHIVLVPLVSAYLFFRNREAIFSNPRPVYPFALIFLAFGGALYSFGYGQGFTLNQNDYSALLTFSAIVFWGGCFALLYGIRGFQKASFPIFFLVFMIPIPSVILDKIIYALQVGSTTASEIIFWVTGVPFQRDGFVFHLPGISVEVAEQCSGIRSSLALLITSVLAGHFFLGRFWKKLTLAFLVFPVTIVKNAVRIITLSLLGAYVDERWLTGSFLHQSGGFVFFIPALGFLGLALWTLRRGGVKDRERRNESHGKF
jgi:exosortase